MALEARSGVFVMRVPPTASRPSAFLLRHKRVTCLLVVLAFFLLPTSYGQVLDKASTDTDTAASPSFEAWNALPPATREAALSLAHYVDDPIERALPGFPGFPQAQTVDLTGSIPYLYSLAAHSEPSSTNVTSGDIVRVTRASIIATSHGDARVRALVASDDTVTTLITQAGQAINASLTRTASAPNIPGVNLSNPSLVPADLAWFGPCGVGGITLHCLETIAQQEGVGVLWLVIGVLLLPVVLVFIAIAVAMQVASEAPSILSDLRGKAFETATSNANTAYDTTQQELAAAQGENLSVNATLLSLLNSHPEVEGVSRTGASTTDDAINTTASLLDSAINATTSAVPIGNITNTVNQTVYTLQRPVTTILSAVHGCVNETTSASGIPPLAFTMVGPDIPNVNTNIPDFGMDIARPTPPGRLPILAPPVGPPSVLPGPGQPPSANSAPGGVGRGVACVANTFTNNATTLVAKKLNGVLGTVAKDPITPNLAPILKTVPLLLPAVAPARASPATSLNLALPTLPSIVPNTPNAASQLAYETSPAAYAAACIFDATTSPYAQRAGSNARVMNTLDSLRYNVRVVNNTTPTYDYAIPIGVPVDIDPSGSLPWIVDSPANTLLPQYTLRVSLTLGGSTTSTLASLESPQDSVPTLQIENIGPAEQYHLLVEAYVQIPNSDNAAFIGYDDTSLPDAIGNATPAPDYFETTIHTTSNTKTGANSYAIDLRTANAGSKITTPNTPLLPLVAGAYATTDCDPTKASVSTASATFLNAQLSPPPALVSLLLSTTSAAGPGFELAWTASSATDLNATLQHSEPITLPIAGGGTVSTLNITNIQLNVTSLPITGTLTYAADNGAEANYSISYHAWSIVPHANLTYENMLAGVWPLSFVNINATNVPADWTLATTGSNSVAFQTPGVLGSIDAWAQTNGAACLDPPHDSPNWFLYESTGTGSSCTRLHASGIQQLAAAKTPTSMTMNATTNMTGTFHATLENPTTRLEASLSNVPAKVSLMGTFGATTGNLTWNASEPIDTLTAILTSTLPRQPPHITTLTATALPTFVTADYDKTTNKYSVNANAPLRDLSILDTTEALAPSFANDYVYHHMSTSGVNAGLTTFALHLTNPKALSLDDSDPTTTIVTADIRGAQPATIFLANDSASTRIDLTSIPRNVTLAYRDDHQNGTLALDYASTDTITGLAFTRVEGTGTWTGNFQTVPTRVSARVNMTSPSLNVSLPAGGIGDILMQRIPTTDTGVPAFQGDYVLATLDESGVSRASVHITGLQGGSLEWITPSTVQANLQRNAATPFTLAFQNTTSTINATFSSLPPIVTITVTPATGAFDYEATPGTIVGTASFDAHLPQTTLQATASNVPSSVKFTPSPTVDAWTFTTNGASPMTSVSATVNTLKTMNGQTKGEYTNLTATQLGDHVSFALDSSGDSAEYANTQSGIPIASDVIVEHASNTTQILDTSTLPSDGFVMFKTATTTRLVAVLHGLTQFSFQKGTSGFHVDLEKAASAGFDVTYNDTTRGDATGDDIELHASPGPSLVHVTLATQSTRTSTTSVNFTSTLSSIVRLDASGVLHSTTQPIHVALSSPNYPAYLATNYDEATGALRFNASSPVTLAPFQLNDPTMQSLPSTPSGDYVFVDERASPPTISASLTLLNGIAFQPGPRLDVVTGGGQPLSVNVTGASRTFEAELGTLSSGTYHASFLSNATGGKHLNWTAPSTLASVHVHVAPPSNDSTTGEYLDATFTRFPAELDAVWSDADHHVSLHASTPIGTAELYYANNSTMPQLGSRGLIEQLLGLDGGALFPPERLVYIKNPTYDNGGFTDTLDLVFDRIQSINADWRVDASGTNLTRLTASLTRASDGLAAPADVLFESGGSYLHTALSNLRTNLSVSYDRNPLKVGVHSDASHDLALELLPPDGSYVNVNIKNLPTDVQLAVTQLPTLSTVAWDASGPSGTTQLDLETSPQAGAKSADPCAATAQARLFLTADNIPPSVHASLDCPLTRLTLDTPSSNLGSHTQILFDQNPDTQAPEPNEANDFLAIKNDSGYSVFAARLDGLATAVINAPTGKFADALSASVTFTNWNPSVYVEVVNNSDTPMKIELNGVAGTTSFTYDTTHATSTRITYAATDPLDGLRLSIPMSTSNTASPPTFLGDPITNLDIQVRSVSATGPNLVGILLEGTPTYDYATGTWGGTPTLQAGAYTDAAFSNLASATIGSVLATITLQASSAQTGGVSQDKVEGLTVGRLTVMATDNGKVDTAGPVSGTVPDQMITVAQGSHKSLYVDTQQLATGASPSMIMGRAGNARFQFSWSGAQRQAFAIGLQNETTTFQATLSPLPPTGKINQLADRADQKPTTTRMCGDFDGFSTAFTIYAQSPMYGIDWHGRHVISGCSWRMNNVGFVGTVATVANAVLDVVDPVVWVTGDALFNTNSLFSFSAKQVTEASAMWDLLGAPGNSTYPNAPTRQFLVNSVSPDPKNATFHLTYSTGNRGFGLDERGDALSGYHTRFINPTEGTGQDYNPDATVYSTDGIAGNWTAHSVTMDGRTNDTGA